MNQLIIRNYGIIASISWNSKKWAEKATSEDLDKSKYVFVKEENHMHEDLNFGHEKFSSEDDGYYIGYTPMFNRLPDSENSKNVKIVFFISSDYRNSNRKSIIGFYGYPILGICDRLAEDEIFDTYDNGNLKALPENIIYF